MTGAAAALLAGLLTGCGAPTTRMSGDRVTVHATEYADHPRKLQVPAGRIVFVLHNDGVLDHDLGVSRDGRILARTRAVRPRHTGRLVVRLAPGRYRLGCTFFSHDQLGEHAELVVR